MSRGGRRILLSLLALACLAPAPLLAGAPWLAPALDARLAGIPLSVWSGVLLILALVVLAWIYAGLSLDTQGDGP